MQPFSKHSSERRHLWALPEASSTSISTLGIAAAPQGPFPGWERVRVGGGEILGQVGLPTLTSKWSWETWPGCFRCPLLCLIFLYFAFPPFALPCPDLALRSLPIPSDPIPCLALPSLPTPCLPLLLPLGNVNHLP